MEIAIFGDAQSGKSTLFQIMTGVNSQDMYGEKFVRAIAKVPDARFDALVDLFSPQKASPAAIPFVDVQVSGEKAFNEIKQHLSGVDGIVHVIGAYRCESVDECVLEYKALADDLILADLMTVENTHARLQKKSKAGLTPADKELLDLLLLAKSILEKGEPLRGAPFTDVQKQYLRGYSLWSLKPELIVLNTGEDNSIDEFEFQKQAVLKSSIYSICCQLEAELVTLSLADRVEFMESLGIESPAFVRIIQGVFSLLSRIVFFTVGEDEVKAWVIPDGSVAPKAAAAIHRDFERGFIKAEVVNFDDMIQLKGNWGDIRSHAKLRLEGKQYIVKDGEIIHFRFNV